MDNPFKQPNPAEFAAKIVAAFDRGPNRELMQSEVLDMMQQWAEALGGTAPMREMLPEHRPVYLLALAQIRQAHRDMLL